MFSFAAADQIDLLCDDFESAWRQGTPRPIEEYLHPADTSLVTALRAELLQLELECRFRRGERPRVEDYVRRFPECAEALPRWLEEATRTARLFAPAPPASTVNRAPALETPIAPAVALSARPLPPVLGEYELLEQLGAGGMGEVYRARHRRLGKFVALKVMRETRLASADGLARFRRETEAVGQLDHPHLVEAHDAGEQDGVVYLVLKLIDGVDLHRLVKERGPLPAAEACELIRQAALGLQYLHERGLVHRDLKPSNLMRTASGTVKVLDLGLARLHSVAGPDHLTAPNTIMGTPDYLAPEQIDNAAAVDIRADLYSLGATLFYLLTGKAPFGHRQELLAKLKAHGMETPADVRSLRSEVPAGVAALVTRLLAKRPEERFATPQELADALTQLATTQGAPDALLPATLTTVPAPPVQLRQRTLLTIAAGLTLVPTRKAGRTRVGCSLQIVAAGLLLATLGVGAKLALENSGEMLSWSKDIFVLRGGGNNDNGEPPGDPTKGRRWAVIVGINNYSDSHFANLESAAADAKLLARTLVDFGGYDKSDVLLLTDDAEKDQLRPRRSNLKGQIAEWLKKPSSRNDSMLVFFSGHGFIDKGKSYLVPKDGELANPVTTCWLTSELRGLLQGCEASHKLLILDSCHAGGKALGAKAVSSEELGASFRGVHGLITLASCSKQEVSFDYDDKKQGLFTFFLAEGLRGQADKPPNGNGDGIVDSDELYKYTYERVTTTGQKEKNLSQTPVRLMEGVAGTFALAKVDVRVAAASPPNRPDNQMNPPPPNRPDPPLVASPSEEVLKSSIGMELRKIPAGTFQMGSPPAEHPGSDEELHAVTITRAFYMGVTEVTQDEYVRVTKKPNPSFFSANGGGRDKVVGLNTNPFPVEMVSHADAEEFCRLLNQLDKYKLPAGWEYRLPTEAEWEYACRANTTTPYHWGETLSARQANFGAFPFGGAEPGLELIGTRTMPVRTFPSAKNAFGLYDMHGNVSEWCADFFSRGFYQTSSPTDPTGPASGTSRVVRGGSWSDQASGCRSASRTGLAPDDMRSYVGFRVVCAPAR
jgi:formylglycine-generating enzyme required for sulfatase activity/serine/threonine protein kinase